MLTSLQLCSQALVMIGATPITSFADGTAEALVAQQLYEGVAQDLLARHPWRFASRQRALTQVTPAPDGLMPDDRWTAFYEVPVDCLAIEHVTINGRPGEFDRQMGLLLTRAQATDELVLHYTYRAPEAHWPPYFDAPMRLQLASVFALAIANREGVAERMEQAAIRALAAARHLDSAGRTTRAFNTKGLLVARRSRA